jgi:D-beta-D-heptose 7-phosphate kinase/D-beta-D-heptose 1-phosphate adenosyltransferase
MKKILVIGESCKDVFVYCDSIRLAPDVPVPILQITETTENPGMASNVLKNIISHVSDCEIETNSGWENISKTRYIHAKSNHSFFRVDSSEKIKRIDLNQINLDYEYIVIADYNKGYLSEDDILKICKSHSRVFLDTKKILGPWAQSAMYIKINDYEYRNSMPYITDNFKDKIIHTKGGDGCEFQGKEFLVENIEVIDTSGAGDSFMAALVVKYSQTEDIIESINFANACASEIVRHRGVGVI